MAMAVAIMPEIAHQLAAVNVEDDQQTDQGHFYMEPAAADSILQPKPHTESNRQQRTRGHDAEEKFAFHDLETLAADRVIAHCVINEQARQVEQPGEPVDHE